MSLNNLPNLIIAGVHKAGTTSLFTWLAEHPAVCGSSIKEIGYFMPLHYGTPLTPIENYSSYFKDCTGNKKIRLEASPSYIYGGKKIIDAIKTQLTGAKILIVLRNPTERLFSFYERKKVNTYLPADLTFKMFFEKSVALQHIHETSGANDETLFIRGVKEGYYVNYLPDWFNAFTPAQLKICFFENMKADSELFMKDICNWLDIDAGFFNSQNLKAENTTTTYGNTSLHKMAIKINRGFESFWRNNMWLKRSIRKMYNSVNKGGAREKLSAADKQMVDELYQPFNQRLAILLNKEGIESLPAWLQTNQN